MRTVPVMEAVLDVSQLDEIEVEAVRAGVPLEHFFIEGWRRALWAAMKARDEENAEQGRLAEAARHLRVDANSALFQETLKANLSKRHKRLWRK